MLGEVWNWLTLGTNKIYVFYVSLIVSTKLWNLLECSVFVSIICKAVPPRQCDVCVFLFLPGGGCMHVDGNDEMWQLTFWVKFGQIWDDSFSAWRMAHLLQFDIRYKFDILSQFAYSKPCFVYPGLFYLIENVIWIYNRMELLRIHSIAPHFLSVHLA